MEEKKALTVRLSTVILLFIIFLLVMALVMVYYLDFVKESKPANETNSSISSNISSTIVNNDPVQEDNSKVINNSSSLNNDSVSYDEASNEKILDINSAKIQSLYSKILKTNMIYSGNNMEKCCFYKDSKVTAQNLSNEEKVITVLQYLSLNNQGTKISFSNIQSSILNKMSYYFDGGDFDYCTKYSAQEIETAKKDIFGNDIQINWISVGTNAAYQIDYIDGNYYAYAYPGGGGNWGLLSFNQIQKAVEDDNYIYIYDKYLYAVLSYGNNLEETLNFYTNSDMNVKIDSSSNYYEYENYFNNNNNTIINKYLDKLNTYKHTFKKSSNGDYYWVSTEIVNN